MHSYGYNVADFLLTSMGIPPDVETTTDYGYVVEVPLNRKIGNRNTSDRVNPILEASMVKVRRNR